MARLRGSIRFDDLPDQWFDLELATPADADPRFPHVEACVRLPPSTCLALDLVSTLRLANELNPGEAGATVSWDEGAKRITLRSRVVFSGALENGEQRGEQAHVLEEVALNMVVAVLSGAKGCHLYVARFVKLEGSKGQEP